MYVFKDYGSLSVQRDGSNFYVYLIRYLFTCNYILRSLGRPSKVINKPLSEKNIIIPKKNFQDFSKTPGPEPYFISFSFDFPKEYLNTYIA